MPSTPTDSEANPFPRWHGRNDAAPISATGDVGSARQRLAHSIGDDAALARLRLLAHGLSDGTDLSRLDDQQLIDHLAAAMAEGKLRRTSQRPKLLHLVPATAPAPAPAAPPPSARRAAPVAPPPAVETTFGSDLDVAAMVAVLTAAAQDGTPFCEECAKAAARRDAEATPA